MIQYTNTINLVFSLSQNAYTQDHKVVLSPGDWEWVRIPANDPDKPKTRLPNDGTHLLIDGNGEAALEIQLSGTKKKHNQDINDKLFIDLRPILYPLDYSPVRLVDSILVTSRSGYTLNRFMLSSLPGLKTGLRDLPTKKISFPKQGSTGFWRIAKIGNHWRMVAPDGLATFLAGISAAQLEDTYTGEGRSPYIEHMKKEYGNRWRNKHLKLWSDVIRRARFNCFGSWVDEDLRARTQLPWINDPFYTDNMDVLRPDEGSRPLPDPSSSRTIAEIKRICEQEIAPLADDKMIIGHRLGNEAAWKKDDYNLCSDITELLVNEIRQVDKNHLILGYGDMITHMFSGIIKAQMSSGVQIYTANDYQYLPTFTAGKVKTAGDYPWMILESGAAARNSQHYYPPSFPMGEYANEELCGKGLARYFDFCNLHRGCVGAMHFLLGSNPKAGRADNEATRGLVDEDASVNWDRVNGIAKTLSVIA